MSHENLNQKGQRAAVQSGPLCCGSQGVPLSTTEHLECGKEDVQGCKAKHIDHYVGPATITKKIDSRSFQLSFVNPSTGTTQLVQRDVGMIILKKEWHALTQDPAELMLAPARHQVGMLMQ